MKVEWDEFVTTIAAGSPILTANLPYADFVDRVVAYGREWYGDED